MKTKKKPGKRPKAKARSASPDAKSLTDEFERIARRIGKVPPPFSLDPAYVAKRNKAAIALLDKWAKEGPSHDEGTLQEFKKALERNRLGQRRLFRD